MTKSPFCYDSYMFPDKFKFTPYIVMSMVCLLTGIYLYETKKAAPQVQEDSSAKQKLSGGSKEKARKQQATSKE